MRRSGSAVLAILVVVGCGSFSSEEREPPVTSSSDPVPSTSSTTGPLDVIVPPDNEGSFPDDTLVSCGAGTFPIGAIDEIESLENGDPGGLAEAIAPFLEGEEGASWPQTGWQILYMTDDRALLVANDEMTGLAFMNAEHNGSEWSWAGATGGIQECRLQFALPDGLNTVDWRLDPDGPPLDQDAAEIAVILNERECVGGIEIGDRLVGPQVVMTESQVFLAFAAQPPAGDAFTCEGNPDTPFVVTLPEPIGEREVVEGLDTGVVLDDYID